MCELSEDGSWESDHSNDFSLMTSRLASFRGCGLAQQVSAERLARAGFYFTGPADRVCCFSCQKTVENWCSGDTPVERHKEVSPSCKFLSCTHRTGFNPSSCSPLTNGSTYNEEAEDMEYRLRTGEVVDESIYPMAPHMRSEEARLHTFSSWPSALPVRGRDLAQAGLYYLGESDRVQCFCCGGMLGGWEAGDTGWGEHTKHFPYCFFILGHDVGNVPSEGGTEEGEEGSSMQHANAHPVQMGSLEERLRSFGGGPHSIDPERLARAGFYSTGTGDRVLCFHCGGGLKGWQADEDPWEEHAKHYPGCSFLLTEKGQEFVNSIQLQEPRPNRATSRHHNGYPADKNEVLSSGLAQQAIGMGLEPTVLQHTILEKIRTTGSGYSSLEQLVEDCLKNTPHSDVAKDEDPLEKLRKLQREKQCKICMDRDICIVLVPCGHLVTCKECSQSLLKCPICCGAITQKIKTYIS